MVQAYSKVAAVSESPWLKELESAASSSRITLRSGLRHFITYFDHVGCLEVVALSVRLS